MKNRFVSVLLIFSLSLLVNTGCGLEQSLENEEISTDVSSTDSTVKADIVSEVLTSEASIPDEVSEDEYVMIVCHSQPESTPRHISLMKFAEDVEEKTEGHVAVTIYGSGQIGTEKEMLERVSTGEVQGMRGGNLDSVPRLLMFTAPFLAHNRAEITALLKSDLAQKILDEVNTNSKIQIINLCDAGGFRQFSNNIHPIQKPEDFEGLTMRTNGMFTGEATFHEMGAKTVYTAYSELYMALKSGQADGQENPWVNVEGMRFYEVQKYFTEVNYQFNPDPFFVNTKWWNDLPDEYREIIKECASDMADYNDKLIDQNTEAARNTVAAHGAEIYVPSETELEAFETAVSPVYDAMITEGICTQEEIDEMKEIIANTN